MTKYILPREFVASSFFLLGMWNDKDAMQEQEKIYVIASPAPAGVGRGSPWCVIYGTRGDEAISFSARQEIAAPLSPSPPCAGLREGSNPRLAMTKYILPHQFDASSFFWLGKHIDNGPLP